MKQSTFFQEAKRSVLLLIFAISTASIFAQTTWTGAMNTDWSLATNWSAGVPTATLNAVIPNVPNKPTLFSGSAVAKSVLIQASSALTINSGASLAMTGLAAGSDASFFNQGTVTNSGTVNIQTTSSLTGIRNDASFQNNVDGIINIVGQGSDTTGIDNTANFTNYGKITISGSVSRTDIKSSGSFLNSGCASLIDIGDPIAGPGFIQNEGNMIERSAQNSHISNNSGFIQNLNGGTFIINSNTGLLTTTTGDIWTGCTSTDWADPTNWLDQTVPTTTDNVTIPNVTNKPIVMAGTAAVAKSVTVNASSSLTVNASGSLAISGSSNFGFTNNGTVVNEGTISINSTSNSALLNNASFTNKNLFQIGNIGSVGVAIEMTAGSTFVNQTGSITIERASIGISLLSNPSPTTFTNNATITIGSAGTSITNQAIFMAVIGNGSAVFNNTPCSAVIDIVASAPINVISTGLGTFNNAGLITERSNTTSHINTNTGIVQNLNGGTFNIDSGNPAVTTSGAVDACCVAPAFTACPSNMTVFTGPAATLCSAVATYTATASGNPMPTFTYSFNGNTAQNGTGSGSTLPVGVTNVVVTATNSCGSTTCGFSITVVDNTPPTAVCKNISVNLVGSSASITAAQIDNGSSDNCSFTLSASPTSFNCSNLGPNTVILTVTDGANNTSTCSSTVTVVDNTPPIAVCKNISVNLVGSSASITASQIDNGSSDNCSFTLSASPTNFSCSNLGPNTVVLTVTDGSSHSSTCSSIVTVVDNTPPTITCSNNLVVNTDPGQCSARVCYPSPVASDNCVPATPAGYTYFSQYGSSYYYTSNAKANYATARANARAAGGHLAVITSAAEQSINPPAFHWLGGSDEITEGTWLWETCEPFSYTNWTAGEPNNSNGGEDGLLSWNSYTWNDGVVTQPEFSLLEIEGARFVQTAGLPQNAIFPLGTTTNTFLVTDASGQTATCSFSVTVVDNAPPTAVCQNINVPLAGASATITASQVNNGSSDNCTISLLSLSKTSFNCSNLGPNTVVLTVKDQSNNTATCSATVTVSDNTPPIAVCQNISVPLAGASATITATQVNNGSTDNCTISMFSLNKTTFDCSNIGPNTVVLTVKDQSNNTATCTAIVTVNDNTPPSAACQNIVRTLDAEGSLYINATEVDNGSSDNCSFSLGLSTSDFTCANLGLNTVTLTVTDASGNTATCQSFISINDNMVPTAVCQNKTVALAGSSATVAATEINNGSTDNCTISMFSLNKSSYDCSNLGQNTVVLTVKDQSNNTATCSAIITVLDQTPPAITCQTGSVTLAAGNGSNYVGIAQPASLLANATDNCTPYLNLSKTVSPNNFTCANIGLNNVVVTVVDGAGNVATCSTTVNVLPPPSQLSVNNPSVLEGSPTGLSPLTFTVSRTFPGCISSVNWATADGSATVADNDFVAGNGTLNFAAGQGSQTVVVQVKRDSKVELNETFSVNLSNPFQASIANGTGLGTITNDESAVIQIANASNGEGNAGLKNINFTATLSNPADVPITFNFTTSDGSATLADNDYVACSTCTATIPAGAVSAVFSVQAKGDTKAESNEIINVALSNLQASGRSASLANSSRTATILNDDGSLKGGSSGAEKQASGPEIVVFPNPTNDFLQVILPETENAWQLAVIDVFGKMVFQQKVVENRFELDASNLPSGLYFLIAKNEVSNKSQTIRFVKAD